ncbi:hypothetical protein A671_04680 [Salmonella enterica subsp. enterica serovar Dublin str. DG22]|uniref:Uncharacterized protein n=1 Tax=Salmonella enterica subsp. enterica serovar Dublin str. UC16 TaxID=1192688 RepID=M7SAW7_SALDU|nr:hypothetical protein A670_02685 [Salmonella enterica subsp. enterica serovar Dublin str. UC16]EPI64590.1 hypothetical protein A671_04680 [Salmonella enterica subsp. enterica serovar Dublin str. DG22]
MVLIPPWFGGYISKKPVLLYELFLEYGGEGGAIFTFIIS